ncbi:H-NS family histone-like protein [Kushneria aurantia]|uniref:H-NS histone family protein n=1 Tax=Kushneria aurantia TaxID=504092 RepID=A0ABV6G114_9GAMM|nr:H-NS histone family protein [Kushneria aurantia]
MSNESSETLEKIARNKNVARAAARQLSMEQLGKLSEIINEVMAQKHDEERQRQQEEAQKEKKLAEIRAAMSDAGLSVNDLVGGDQPRKRRGRPPKGSGSEQG